MKEKPLSVVRNLDDIVHNRSAHIFPCWEYVHATSPEKDKQR